MASKPSDPEWQDAPPPAEAEAEAEAFQARTVSADEGRVDYEQRAAATVSPGTAVVATELSMQEPTRAADVMTEAVKTASPDTDLATVAALMRDENVGIVPIVDGRGHLVGVLTDRDIVVRVDANHEPAADVKAGDVMTRKLVTVRPHDDLFDVIDRMGAEGLQRLLVVDDRGRLAGIISVSDLARRTDLPERVQDTVDQISRHRG
jgi:CBS domain-containing protein